MSRCLPSAAAASVCHLSSCVTKFTVLLSCLKRRISSVRPFNLSIREQETDDEALPSSSRCCATFDPQDLKFSCLSCFQVLQQACFCLVLPRRAAPGSGSERSARVVGPRTAAMLVFSQEETVSSLCDDPSLFSQNQKVIQTFVPSELL